MGKHEKVASILWKREFCRDRPFSSLSREYSQRPILGVQ